VANMRASTDGWDTVQFVVIHTMLYLIAWK